MEEILVEAIPQRYLLDAILILGVSYLIWYVRGFRDQVNHVEREVQYIRNRVTKMDEKNDAEHNDMDAKIVDLAREVSVMQGKFSSFCKQTNH